MSATTTQTESSIEDFLINDLNLKHAVAIYFALALAGLAAGAAGFDAASTGWIQGGAVISSAAVGWVARGRIE